MIIRFLLPFLALAEIVFGQATTTGGSAGTTTSTAAVQTWTVSVGKADNSFVVCFPHLRLTFIILTSIEASGFTDKCRRYR